MNRAKALGEKTDQLVSILICSRNRREDLKELVRSLQDMNTLYTFEIVVVEETDNPMSMQGIRYVAHSVKNLGIPYARNLALRHARGEIVVFLDDDCVISDGLLDRLIEPLKDDSVVGVQGGVTVPEGTNAIGWAESIIGFPGGGIRRIQETRGKNQETQEISTLNCAYRKSDIDRVGGFDERLVLGGEDYVMAKQVCNYGRCLFVPRALVRHKARGTLRKIWEWFVRRGRAEIAMLKAGAQEKVNYLTVLRSSLMIKLSILITLAFFWFGHAGLFFVLCCLVYGFFQYVRLYKAWRLSSSTFKSLAVLPVVKITMDIGMDWGRLRGLFFD